MVTLPFPGMAPFHVTVFEPMFATAVPLVALALTSVNEEGKTSVSSLPGLSAWASVPELVRTIVYVTTEPSACVVPPATDFAAETLGGLLTAAAAVAELFEPLESGTEAATLAVLLIGVPAGVAGSTTTLRVKVATAEAASEGIEQVIVPLVPGVGVVHDQPPGETSDTNRSGAGRTSVIVTPGASLGPELVITIVYCCELPGRTSPGVRVFVMPRSKTVAD